MKVKELIHKLLEVDQNYEIIVSEFYSVEDEDQVWRIDKQIVGHVVDDEKELLIFVIPNKDGKVGNEYV